MRPGWQGITVKVTAYLGFLEPVSQRAVLKWLQEHPAAKAAVATRDADAARTPLQQWDAAAWESILGSAWDGFALAIAERGPQGSARKLT